MKNGPRCLVGYYMNQYESDFMIAAANKESALAAIKGSDPVSKETCGGGSSHELDGSVTKSFAWVDMHALSQAQTLSDAVKEWRWNIEENEGGDVVEIWFDRSKLGDDEILFRLLAPFVESGSFITMTGEDMAIWRWSFNEGKCEEQAGRIVFDD